MLLQAAFAHSTFTLVSQGQHQYKINTGNVTQGWSVFGEDVDGDSNVELILTGDAHSGRSFEIIAQYESYIALYEWDGSTYTLENKTTWNIDPAFSTQAVNLDVDDVDGDSTKEIVVASLAVGTGSRNDERFPDLRVFSRSGAMLTTEGNISWQEYGTFNRTSIWGIHVSDVDDDTTKEIILAGGAGNSSEYDNASMWIFTWDGRHSQRRSHRSGSSLGGTCRRFTRRSRMMLTTTAQRR